MKLEEFVISFFAGAILGAVGALINYWWRSLPVHWEMVGLVALAMGILAAVLGKKFWNTIFNVWP